MGVLHAPMLLALCALIGIFVGFLWDLVVERDHPFLGGSTTSNCTGLGPFPFFLCQVSLFDALKHFKQLANTLWHSATSEFVLVLPVR